MEQQMLEKIVMMGMQSDEMVVMLLAIMS